MVDNETRPQLSVQTVEEAVCELRTHMRFRHDTTIKAIAANIELAHKNEARSIERIVRDAIVDYNEMYPSAPNDEAERDLRKRAARANAWLKQHGFEEEPFYWSKEETK